MSKFSELFFNSAPKETEERSILTDDSYSNPVFGTLNFRNTNPYSRNKSLKLAVCYRCINIISDSIAVLEINNFIKKGNWNKKQYNKLYELLNIAPNPFMSAFTFKKMLTQYLLMSGNAYILIKRDSNDNINELVLLDPMTVIVLAINGDIKYSVTTAVYYNLPLVKPQVFDKSDIIHIQNFSLNGFVGISTLDYASLVLSTAYSSEVQANNFFSSNNVLTGILKPSAGNHLTQDKAESAKAAFLKNLQSGLGTGSNSVIVLDSGLDYQAIATSPKESMLIENRQFSGLQVCQFFGVPPHKVFLDQRTLNQNNETQQIEFLNSTLLPLIEKLESEIYRKVVLPVDYNNTDLKTDVSNLLRLDATAQADVWTKLFGVGGITSNEIRQKLDMDTPMTGGNRAYVAQNVQPLDQNLNDIKAGQTPSPTMSGDTKQIMPNNFNNNTNKNG